MTAPERPWCVMVSGSRDMMWHHADLIEDKLRPFSGIRQSLMIHGAGEGRRPPIPGCDRVAADIAVHLKFRVHGYPALWNLQDKGAGPIRNHLLTDILRAHGKAGYRLAMLAFSTGGPGTEGALGLVRLMAQAYDQEITIEKIDVTL